MVKYLIKGNENTREPDNNNQMDFISAFANIISEATPLINIKQNAQHKTQTHNCREYKPRTHKNEGKVIHTKADYKDYIQIQASLGTEEYYKTLQAYLAQLDSNCLEILIRYYWRRESMENIEQALNIKTDSTKNSKHQCMEQLHKLIYGKSKC